MFRRIVAATMIGALALTTGCGLHNPFTSKAEPVTYESVAQSELSPEEKVDKLVANMSDADKVGQLLMIGKMCIRDRPTMPAQLVAMRQGINNYSSVIVVAVLLLSMGSFALTQDFIHTVTLLLVLCPCSLELILVALMMGSLVDDASPVSELSKGTKQSHLGLLIVSIVFHVAIICVGVLGLIDPVTAVALHGLARLGLVYNLKVLNGSLCVA